jgi:Protein of unknown function (DUF2585)
VLQASLRGKRIGGGIMTKERRTSLVRVGIGAAIFAVAALAEHLNGRKLWGISGEPGIWSGDVNSSHNSQFMIDPYSFTHISHGAILFGLVTLFRGKLPAGARALIAIAIEAVWEIVENTDFVINRYRAETISLHYYGDSIMNSMCDIGSCVVGILIARILPVRATVALIIVMELALAFWIRDNLLLNIIMLVAPIRAIKHWQMAQ